MKLSLYNSLTRKREFFSPIDDKLVKMYVCGPTVYDHPHIGNARSVVVYDVLYRILIKLFGYDNIRYVRNITDIDDKIMVRALEEKISISELTKKTINYFHDDMDYLGCKRPNIEPKATDHLQEMIEIINKLLAKDIAYKADGHVYFDVTKAQDYNKLSGRLFEDMFQGVRIESSEAKKHPGDFVLWKPSSPEDDECLCWSPTQPDVCIHWKSDNEAYRKTRFERIQMEGTKDGADEAEDADEEEVPVVARSLPQSLVLLRQQQLRDLRLHLVRKFTTYVLFYK